MVKNLLANAQDVRDAGLIPGSERSPGERNGNPLWYSCLEKSHRQRSLVGYSPWGHKESDMTEQLHGGGFQYSCLENPMDRGAWQATVHCVARVKSRTRLRN